MQKKAFIFFIVCFGIFTNLWAKSGPVVSVRIAKSLKDVIVSGLDLKRYLHFNENFKKFSGKQAIKFNCSTVKNLNPEKNRPILLATLESDTGLLTYQDSKYRGQFKILSNNNGDSCDLVNDVPMETYIASLLSKEMNSNWPIEALKAQAVAARTYALHKMNSNQVSNELGAEAYYDLESSEKHQVTGNFFDLTKKTEEASRLTNGEVLLNENQEIKPIYFHAKCGGKTLRPDQVWKNKEKSFESVNCPFCHNIGANTWNNSIDTGRMIGFIKWAVEKKYLDKIDGNEFNSIVLVPDSIDKYTVNFYINDRPYRIEKGLLRNYFGRFIFPSNSFSIKSSLGRFYVVGEGLGHNVGLCQTGALTMAKMGWSYKKILAHYFPKHLLKKVY